MIFLYKMPFLKSLWKGVKTIGKTLRKVSDNEHVQGLVRNLVPGGSAIVDTYNKVTNVADKAYDAYKKIKHAFKEPSDVAAQKQPLQPSVAPSYDIKPRYDKFGFGIG
jgi:hypothetical protein